MSEMTLNQEQLKEILKTAIVELIRDNHEEISEFLAEIIEDMAMERAIAEGETTPLVSREAIFQLLGPKGWGTSKNCLIANEQKLKALLYRSYSQ
jgi:hypothetical protein